MRNIVLVLFSFFYVHTLFCQTLRFEHPTDKTNFLRGSISELLQDRQGFIWVATSDGLGKYDGKTVVEYRNIRGDTTSLSNNYISDLYEDSEGRIWVATTSGLNCYFPKSDSFVQYFNYDGEDLEGENYILSVVEDQKGFIWYSTYGGVFRIDPKSGSSIFVNEELDNNDAFSHKVVWDIFEDSKGTLWFATRNGITYYSNDDSFQFQKIKPNPGAPNALQHERVFKFAEQKNGTIWVGTDTGIYRLLETKGGFKFKQYAHDPKKINSLSHDFIEDIKAEGDDKLWVSTWAGGLNEVILAKNDTEEIQFIHHKNDPDNSQTLSLNRIKTSLIDRSGILWVGTRSGLDKSVASNWKFKNITPIQNTPKSLSHSIIKSILKDSHGNLWIGTYDGLNFLSSENYKNGVFEFQIFKHEKANTNSISHNNIFTLEEDSLGFLWIGTYRGLNYINLNTFFEEPVFEKIYFPDNIPHSWIYDVLEIKKGKYWIATYGKLAKMTFDPNKNEDPDLQVFDMNPKVNDALVNATTYQVCKDRYGQFWVGTFLGLSKYIQKNGRDYFDNYQFDRKDTLGISDNSIICLKLDSKGNLWIGTRNGLNLVIQKSAEEKAVFRSFGSQDGFPNDVIQSIEEDVNGLLWIGTNKGLVHFDPKAAIENGQGILKVYNQDDGLLAQGFIFRATEKADNGTLFFGTSKGLNYFTPSELIENQNVGNIVFTKLKVSNKKITPSEKENSILKKSIQLTDTLILRHFQNDIELEFAALDFANPLQNEYQFKLEGYNEDWIYSGNNNSATYTNIPNGDFIFKVKASNNDGVWIEEPKQLFIKVLPPWWKTWWANILYVLIFSIIIYGWIRWRVHQRVLKIKQLAKIQTARYEERELLREKNAADFHDELGHRLTKVSLFLELAEREAKENSNLTTFLKKIKTNTIGLSEGIRDLIWSLDPKKDTLFQTIIRLQEFGDRLFEFSNINFKMESVDNSFEKIDLEPETRKHVLMIFKEAMNNSLKYSDAEKAMLHSQTENGHVEIIFKDDGKGFDLFQKRKGYGLKNMKDRAEKINGIIEMKTKDGEGTEIRLKIPILINVLR